MKEKHAQKNFGAMAPTPLSLKTQGGGLGGVAYKDRAWPALPPPPVATPITVKTQIFLKHEYFVKMQTTNISQKLCFCQ